MFAVIRTGGKQYKVAVDDEITIEKLAAGEGDVVQFNDVLMLGGADGVKVGAPLLDDAGVQAEVTSQMRGEKVYNFKKRRRKHSSARLKGHRQSLTVVKIKDIPTSGAGASGVSAAAGAGSVSAADVAASSTAPKAPAAPQAFADVPPSDAAPKPDASDRPSNLLTEAQGEPDDLTKISGVGPKLNDKLNDNGVYHFWQIAEWGPAEIAFMDDQLSFKGRIERDNWIDQAKKLAEDAKDA